jgi:hypothetical protein
MSERTAPRLAWATFALTGCLTTTALVLGLLVRDHASLANGVLNLAFALVYGLFGALIASRQPRNAIGWLLAGIGLFVSATSVSSAYAIYSILVAPGRYPAGAAAEQLGSGPLDALLFLLFALILQLLPNGRPLTPRWRVVVWTCWAGAVLGLARLLLPNSGNAPLEHVANPLVVRGAAATALQWAAHASDVLLLGGLAAGATAVVLRFRRSRGAERQQMKWFAAAVLVELVAVAAGLLLALAGFQWAGVLFWTLFVVFPVVTAISVLRYRLFDIDVVIRKTLVYGALTAVLVAAYLAGVLLLGFVFRSLTGQSGALVVTLSTLGVAALFRPALRRIQSAVDHRFYRRRYDSTRTLEAFAGRLRQQVDLHEVEAEVLDVVHATVRPAHVGLWLRSEDGS